MSTYYIHPDPNNGYNENAMGEKSGNNWSGDDATGPQRCWDMTGQFYSAPGLTG